MFNIWRQPILEYYFLPGSLDEAIDALGADNKCFKQGSIFFMNYLINGKMLKVEKYTSIDTMPHPFEYKMYFNL